MPTLTAEPPFDLVFIDADKSNSAAYLAAALRLSRNSWTSVTSYATTNTH